MKYYKPKEGETFLTKEQKYKVSIATSCLILALYIVAFVVSMCGGTYFLNGYQNEHLLNIHNFLEKIHLIDAIYWMFSTLELALILSFVNKKFPKWYYLVSFYTIPLILFYTVGLPDWCQMVLPFIYILGTPIIENKGFKLKPLIRGVIAIVVTLLLQFLIAGIKTGYIRDINHDITMVEDIAFAIEYDIALLVLFYTFNLILDKEKGEDKCAHHGGFSLISKKKLQTSKTLTINQKRKLRLLYLKVYSLQFIALFLVIIVPSLLGKLVEFTTMYLAFCIVRYILGFKESLHYNREIVCISVGVIIFGLLTLLVPSFTVNMVFGVLFGIGLAILLHLSYKYKSMNLFMSKVAKDRFAILYTIFNGNIEEAYIRKMSNHYKLNELQINLLVDYLAGEKISYICCKYSYSRSRMNELLDECINGLVHSSD